MADPAAPVAVPRPIADHGIVGDLDTTALIASDGTVDFMCWPHLDSPSVFAALLDPDKGGQFTLSPSLPDARKIKLYAPDTNVLITCWTSEIGSAEITDFMPHPEARDELNRCLVRRIEAVRGRVQFQACCKPRFDYARIIPGVETIAQGVRFIPGDNDDGDDPSRATELLFLSCIPIRAGDGEATAEFWLEPGETAWFVLGEEQNDGAPVTGEMVRKSLDRTLSAWRRWSARSTYTGRWREQVTRSALALKLLTSAKHGSIAAAATFGLPEATDGARNWDYRATWIRDASFTVYAFMRLGHVDEAETFRRWVGQRMAAAEARDCLNIMYALDGEPAAKELELDHLAGYGGSHPVRIGNAARHQTQLDIYGELLDSVYLSNKYGSAISREGWGHICAMIGQVRRRWREPDAGIWEIRDTPREFLHSRLMCWVAIDRAMRLARKRSLPAPLVAWSRDRDRIAKDIWTNFRHPERGYFVQTRGGEDLDAALLMMPLVRFVSATDPVWLSTLDAIGEQLADGALVFRYRNADGLSGGEGAFTPCSFWYIECLTRARRLDEAHVLMDRALAHASPLGLFSEEVSVLGEPLGNFPQALTHLAFISAAYFLDRKLSTPNRGLWQP